MREVIPCKSNHPIELAYLDKRGRRVCRKCAKDKDDVLRFGGNRESAIQRDGEKCIRCGMTRIEHWERYRRDITVDHIDGNGRYTEPSKQNHELSNLRTLCISCHGKKDVVRSIQHIKARQRAGSPFWNGDYCKRGHQYTQENTGVRKIKGLPRRTCLTCQRNYMKEYRLKRKEYTHGTK